MTDELREMADYLWNSPQKTHNQIDEVLRKAFDMGKQEGREEAAKWLRKRADHLRGDYNGPDLLDQCAFQIRALSQKPKEG